MVFARLLSDVKVRRERAKEDPFAGLTRDALSKDRPASEEAFRGPYEAVPADPPPGPPPGARTLADFSLAEARHLVGRDAIVREDPMFGRRGRIAEVLPDGGGYLVLVMIYKRTKDRAGRFVPMDKPPPDARRYWLPGKVELA